MEKTLIVDDRGGTREITVQEALQQRTYRDALAGKRPAMREVLRWMKKRQRAQSPSQEKIATVVPRHIASEYANLAIGARSQSSLWIMAFRSTIWAT